MRTLHVGVRVADVEQSVAYHTSLGSEVLGEVRPTASVSLTMLKLPDDDFVSLEFVHEAGHGSVNPRGLSHLVINVDTLERTVTDLAARGIETEAPTSPGGSNIPQQSFQRSLARAEMAPRRHS